MIIAGVGALFALGQTQAHTAGQVGVGMTWRSVIPPAFVVPSSCCCMLLR
jgi:hypothetical protein